MIGHRQLFVGVICSALVLGFLPVAAPQDAGSGADEPMVHLGVSADGDVVFSLISVYDLTEEPEREAFDSLSEDESAQTDIRDRFENRLATVANETPDATATDLTNSTVVVESDDDRGTVIVSLTWADLAPTTDDSVVLSEPFASGFQTDRTVVVSGPTEATITDATPDPASLEDTEASWDADTDLTGFEVTIDLETDDDAISGFGIGGALVGLLGALAIATRIGR